MRYVVWFAIFGAPLWIPIVFSGRSLARWMILRAPGKGQRGAGGTP